MDHTHNQRQNFSKDKDRKWAIPEKNQMGVEG